MLLAGVVVVVLVLVVGLGVSAYALNLGPLKDSGLVACQAIHDDVGVNESSDDSQFRIDQYHAARKKFANSRYGDIRDAGTKLVDLLWQLSQAGDGNDDSDLGAAIVLAASIYSAYSSLAGACSNHGIDIPPIAQS